MAMGVSQFLAYMENFIGNIRSIIFVTYSQMYEYSENFTGKIGKVKLEIICGGKEYGTDHDPTTAIKKVRRSLHRRHLSSKNIVVLYAGKTGMNEMTKEAARIAGTGAIVAVVGCGCVKLRYPNGEPQPNIYLVDWYNGCDGGKGALSKILSGLSRLCEKEA